jgi:RNA 2',3'-cyclic 3'-phosphodiesterase
LFVAIPLPSETQKFLSGLCSGLPGIRWVTPENLHLTLRFIGGADEEMAQEINHALSGLDATAFSMVFSQMGIFGKPQKPRTLWAGIKPSEPLARLHGKIAGALFQTGCSANTRRFTPHITIGRFKGAVSKSRLSAYLEEDRLSAAAPVYVTRFVLFRSHLGNDGVQYQTLAEYHLA